MPYSPYSILVVDDSEDFRLLLDNYLGQLSCKVNHADDGEDAVEMFSRHSYDLVVMDVIMPLMDGVDAIREIRKIEVDRNGKPVPILVLSGEHSVETGVDCMGAGATRMLVKPVGREGFMTMVCDILGINVPES